MPLSDSSVAFDAARARHRALGPGLALEWTERGHPVLHGSCMLLSWGAVSFVGPQGQGKSTLAAQLYVRGHKFVSDGLTLVTARPEGLDVHPGPRWFKLEDSSLRAVGHDPERFQFVYAGLNKRLWQLPEAHQAEPSVLRRVYVLEEGPVLGVERLRGREALSAILANMYLLPFVQGAMRPVLFEQAALVARKVVVCRLRRPRGYEHAAAVVAAIERGHELSDE